jgi:hypothetical protein
MPIIHRRLHPVPLGSETSRVGQIWIIESLRENDRHTGIIIRDHLLDLFLAADMKVEVTFRQVASAAELFASLEALRADVAKTGRYPILDIECHGLADYSGLALSDGSTASWDELKPYLQAINFASRFNLFLVLAACNGGYFAQAARLHELGAVLAYLGPSTEVGDLELVNALKAFFTELFRARDVSDAIIALHTAEPKFPFFYTTAEGFFRAAGEGYLRPLTPKVRRQRARELVYKRRLAGDRHPPSINEMLRRLAARERSLFGEFRRVYFALDDFPENAERFPLTYSDLVRGAAKRHSAASAVEAPAEGMAPAEGKTDAVPHGSDRKRA